MSFDPHATTFAHPIVILDGAIGTMLQASGVPTGKVPELLCLTHPDLITDLHRQYVKSGSDIIYTNTLGANRYKLKDCGHSVEEVITAAVSCAKAACLGSNTKVALSLGPIGTLLQPNGSLSREDAYEMYREAVTAGAAAGADLVVFETMTDLLEVKLAILATKEHTDLPIYCTMTFEQNHRTFTGVGIPSMALTLTGLGVDAIGINCSLGPVEILPLARELRRFTPLPIIIKPNAGMPDLNDNTFSITAEEFCEQMELYLAEGVTIFGGCCGTTPAFIALLAKRLPAKQPHDLPSPYAPVAAICSASQYLPIDCVRVIGERINPTGKPRLKEALRAGDLGYLLTQGLEQRQAGASILDVNIGLPDIDQISMMVTAVTELQTVLDTPLQIDASDPAVIEAALRVASGKPLVNSVNGEQAVMDRIFPLIKKYGAAVVGLTLDENGIPATADQRLAIATRIVDTAATYGIPREDIYIDCLTLTASVQQADVMETLRAVRLVKETLGVKTVLGVSNISFGLPNRELLNHSFLTLALAHGLDCPIINPNIASMMNAIDAFNLLYNYDPGATAYLQRQAGTTQPAGTAEPASLPQNDAEALSEAVKRGLKQQAGDSCQALLRHTPPLSIVNEVLIPTLDDVGTQFELGQLFLPQLIQSATAAQMAFDAIKAAMSAQAGEDRQDLSKGKIILATVKGDVHDIGKNIVKVILENYGYTVIDLGKDVPIETVVQKVLETKAPLLGLSALMTTTVVHMAETIQAVRQVSPSTKIVVGGAVLTPSYAEKIGADFYAKDAKQAVDIAKEVFGSN